MSDLASVALVGRRSSSGRQRASRRRWLPASLLASLTPPPPTPPPPPPASLLLLVGDCGQLDADPCGRKRSSEKKKTNAPRMASGANNSFAFSVPLGSARLPRFLYATREKKRNENKTEPKRKTKKRKKKMIKKRRNERGHERESFRRPRG